MSRDDAYLLDMLRFAREVMEFSRGVTEEQYLSDIEKRRSVERSLELIGEAARRISNPFREEHPDLLLPKNVARRDVF
jgi:uncharacterized protein with HEPN domain